MNSVLPTLRLEEIAGSAFDGRAMTPENKTDRVIIFLQVVCGGLIIQSQKQPETGYK